MDDQQIARFTSLWTQTQTSVLGFIASTVTNFADAEDLLQKVAVIAVAKFGEFDEQGDSKAFTGWAIQIARFEVLKHCRTQAKHRHEPFVGAVDEIATAFVNLAPECDQRRHALAGCLREISGKSREVLQRRYGEGLKTGRIAELLGLSPGNVSVILNRTYKSLRKCIDARLQAEAG